eukprot:scaffold47200_cov63-Phaeocystis_antarctica.AAC.4
MSGDPWDDELPSEADLARFDAAVDERSSVTAAAAQLGITQLHDWQRRVVDAWLAGRDALVLSGTGSGKSACYMLPAVISRANGCRGVALVITPLISLARDQQAPAALVADAGAAAHCAWYAAAGAAPHEARRQRVPARQRPGGRERGATGARRGVRPRLRLPRDGAPHPATARAAAHLRARHRRGALHQRGARPGD